METPFCPFLLQTPLRTREKVIDNQAESFNPGSLPFSTSSQEREFMFIIKTWPDTLFDRFLPLALSLLPLVCPFHFLPIFSKLHVKPL